MVLKKEKPPQGYLRSVPWFLEPGPCAWLCLGTENIKTHKTGYLSSENVNIIWGGIRSRPLQHNVVYLGTETHHHGRRSMWALFMALHMYYLINLHSHPVRLELALSPGRRKGQPTPVFLPGEFQDRGAWWAAIYGSHRVGHNWSDLAAAAAALSPFYLFFNTYVCLFVWLLCILVVSYRICSYSMWDLVPWPGTKPGTRALVVWSLSHWTTREVPAMSPF